MRNDVAEVDLEKVDISHDWPVGIRVTDLDENKEGEGDEKEERGEKGKSEASTGGCLKGGGRRIKDIVLRMRGGGGRIGRCS